MHKVSRTMSTQHPDNILQPFFATNSILEGEDEIKEAFYAFSHLGCHEQLWDCEGKEVDNFVVPKLLSKYPEFFRRHRLGEEKVITLRLPNPSVQKTDAKILLEALHSIPRNFDINRQFYNEDLSPIAEIYLPMVTSAKEVLRVSEYYQQHVIKSQNNSLLKDDITLSQWLGKSLPEKIRVTPLVETTEGMLRVDKIIQEVIAHEKPEEYQRVWLARSDPALNYGSLSAVLINKISLQKLHELERKSSVEILPILGCGSTPFRGNLTPANTPLLLKGYPSVHTFTLQSSFKYDHPAEKVRTAVDQINESKRKEPVALDEERALKIINSFTQEYQKALPLIAPMINKLSPFVPKRRKRKLHIGLFGYSRASAGIQLPRAITFCAALYSMGLPPELLGLASLTETDKEFIRDVYPSFDLDAQQAMRYLNHSNLPRFPLEIQKQISPLLQQYKVESDERNERHHQITSEIMKIISKSQTAQAEELIVQAAHERGFLG